MNVNDSAVDHVVHRLLYVAKMAEEIKQIAFELRGEIINAIEFREPDERILIEGLVQRLVEKSSITEEVHNGNDHKDL